MFNQYICMINNNHFPGKNVGFTLITIQRDNAASVIGT